MFSQPTILRLSALLLSCALVACGSPEPAPEPEPEPVDRALLHTSYNGGQVELDYSVQLPEGWKEQSGAGVDKKVAEDRLGAKDSFNDEISVILVSKPGQSESAYLADQRAALEKDFEKIRFKSWGKTKVGGQDVHLGVYEVTFGFMTIHYELYVWFKGDLAIWLLCGTTPQDAEAYAPKFKAVAETMQIR